MNAPNSKTLTTTIIDRYDGLAAGCCCLSCGSALDEAAPARGEVVVDLGSGRGQDVIRAASMVGPTGRAIGVDLSEEMIAEARRQTPATLDNVRFVRSDLVPLDLPDQSADVVISNCVINHAPDKGAVYREIARVLRPGGRFVVSDVVSEGEVPEAVRDDPEAWAACYGGAITETAYLAAIAAAGLRVTSTSRTPPYEKGGILVRSLTVQGAREAMEATHDSR